MRPVHMHEIVRITLDNRAFFYIGEFAFFFLCNDLQHMPFPIDLLGYSGFGNTVENAIEYPT